MAEKEYIERGELADFLKQEIAKCNEELDNSFGDDCYDQAVRSRMTALIGVWRRITNKSAADVVEVKHGKWIHDYNNVYGCSECLERETMSPKKLKNYCPNCGAKMDGGAE